MPLISRNANWRLCIPVICSIAFISALQACSVITNVNSPTSDTVSESSPEHPQTAWVYKNAGIKQCHGGGTTLQEALDTFAQADIKALAYNCGNILNRQVISVCGGPTNDILLVLIEQQQVASAQEFGFQLVNDLPFRRNPCPKPKPNLSKQQ